MATAKKTTKTKSVKKQPSSVASQTVSSSTAKKFNFSKPSKKMFVLFLAVIILGILIYLFKGFFVAATVNGEIIPRWAVIQKLEKANGEGALNYIITTKLIYREMEKDNISVTTEEVNAQIKKIEDALTAQGRTLEQDMQLKGFATREEYFDFTKINMLLRIKFEKDIVVTDEDVEKYLTDNKEALALDEATEDMDLIKQQIKEYLEEQKLQEKIQPWLESLQQKAAINRFVQY